MKGKRSVWRVADTAVHHEGLGPREGGRGKLETGKGAEGGVRKHQSQARGASKDGQRGGGGGMVHPTGWFSSVVCVQTGLPLGTSVQPGLGDDESVCCV